MTAQEWDHLYHLTRELKMTLNTLVPEGISDEHISSQEVPIAIFKRCINSLYEVETLLNKWGDRNGPQSNSGIGSSVKWLDPRGASAYKSAQEIVGSIQQSVNLGLSVRQRYVVVVLVRSGN